MHRISHASPSACSPRLWADLVAALEVPVGDNGIRLPTGPCGRIHVREKKVELQLQRRSYLHGKVCQDAACPTTSSEIFFKGTGNGKPRLQRMQSRRLRQTQVQRFRRFTSQLSAAFQTEVQSQAAEMNSQPLAPLPSEQELRARLNSLTYCCQCYGSHVACPVTLPLPARHGWGNRQQPEGWQQQQQEEVVEQQTDRRELGKNRNDEGAEQQEQDEDHHHHRHHHHHHRGCWNELVYLLMVSGDLELLRTIDKQGIVSIQAECSRTYGGQAVGRGFDFLFCYHLLPMYLISSAILAAGYQDNPEKWGDMSPGQPHNLRSWLMCDCDYRTCVAEWRKVLKEGVYMKDLRATRRMLDSCFCLLATYFLVRGVAAEPRGIEARLGHALHQAFGLPGAD